MLRGFYEIRCIYFFLTGTVFSNADIKRVLFNHGIFYGEENKRNLSDQVLWGIIKNDYSYLIEAQKIKNFTALLRKAREKVKDYGLNFKR